MSTGGYIPIGGDVSGGTVPALGGSFTGGGVDPFLVKTFGMGLFLAGFAVFISYFVYYYLAYNTANEILNKIGMENVTLRGKNSEADTYGPIPKEIQDAAAVIKAAKKT